MKEKRKSKRLHEFNEITVSVIPGDPNLPEQNVVYKYSEDLSATGAKIRGNILLPVDTLLKIDFTLKTLQEKITAQGKVKWIKVVFEDNWYEAGVEFVNTPKEAIKKIEDYISWKQNSSRFMPIWISAKFKNAKSK